MIPSIILEEAKHFVTFMSSMVEELIGNEEFMLAILRNQNRTAEINDFLNKTLDEKNNPNYNAQDAIEDPADKVFKTEDPKGPQIHKHNKKAAESEEDSDEADYRRYQDYMRRKQAAYEKAVKKAQEQQKANGVEGGEKSSGGKRPHGKYNPRGTKRGQKSPSNFEVTFEQVDPKQKTSSN